MSTTTINSTQPLSISDFPTEVLDNIFIQLASSASTDNNLSSREVCLHWKEIFDRALCPLWLALKEREQKAIQGQQENGISGQPFTLEVEKKCTAINAEDRQIDYFKAFQIVSRDLERSGSITLQPRSVITTFEQLKTANDSLQTIWPAIRRQLPFAMQKDVPLDGATGYQIRAFLCEKNNALALNGITALDLSNLKLKVLPPEICKLPNLQDLNLRNNQLYTLPDSLKKLTALKYLDLASNPLISLPDSISNLKNLTMLCLRSTNLTKLPDWIGNLSHLEDLSLEDCKLESLPESIGDLKELECLMLNRNKLSQLPDSVGSLPNLRLLYVRDNQLTSLPNSIGNLPNLFLLVLSNNNLTELPSSIGDLSTLNELLVTENRLVRLPESIGNLTQLKECDVSDNQLTGWPATLGNLDNLENLDMRGNRFSLQSFQESSTRKQLIKLKFIKI